MIRRLLFRNSGGGLCGDARRCVMACVFFGAWFAAPVALAQPAVTQAIAIDAGSVSQQLAQLSRQFGVAILYKPSDIDGLHGVALHDQLAFYPALSYLLKNVPIAVLPTPAGAVLKRQTPLAVPEPVVYSMPMSEVVVMSYARELQQSLAMKLQTDGVSEAIVAADIAKFPNLNLAEALQRVSGVSISRDAGEGRQIALRGLNPSFILVRLNGFDVLGNTDSPMDSRGQKTRDRAFDFNLFAAELFSAVSIRKTYDASQSEGGIAGTIELQTPKPFDYTEDRTALSLRQGYNDLSGGQDQRVSTVLSRRGEAWGYLGSLAYSERDTQEQGANTTRWRRLGPLGADIALLDPNIQQLWQDEALYLPRGNRYSVWQSEQQRLGLTQVVEYQGEALSANVEWLFSRLVNDRQENHLYLRGEQTTPIIPDQTRVIDAALDGDNLVYARYEQAQMATESRVQYVDTTFRSVSFTLDWQPVDTVNVVLKAAKESSKLAMPLSQKVYTEGVTGVSVDYRTDPFYADIQYDADTANGAVWHLHEIDLERYGTATQFDVIDASMQWRSDHWGTWRGGWQYKQLSNLEQLVRVSNIMRDEWEAFAAGVAAGAVSQEGVVAADDRVEPSWWQPFTEHQRADWIELDTQQIVADVLVEPVDFVGFDDANEIIERIDSWYVSQQLEVARKLRLDWALRYSQTHTESLHSSGQQPVFQTSRYSHLLPSALLTWQLAERHVAKLAWSKNLSRPQFEDIAVNYGISTAGGNTVVRAPNPELKPFLASSYDMAYEWYLDDKGLLAVNGFYKALQDFIVTTREVVDSDHPLPAVLQAQVDLDQYTLISPRNAESAHVLGAEVTYLSPRQRLPAPFHDLRFSLGAAYYRGETAIYNKSTGQRLFTKNLPHLSPFSYNVSLFYEKDRWGLRASTTFRDAYISQVDTNVLLDEDERGFHETLYTDVSAYWQLRDSLRVSLDILNLSNQREEEYSSSADRAYNTTQHGRSYFLNLEFQP